MELLESRAGRALRRQENWLQLSRFCAVGAVGYGVNLGVYALLVHGGVHYLAAAICSFTVAVVNNYTWNRLWTFRATRGHVYYDGLRFFVVSLAALGANLLLLQALIHLEVPKIPAQAVAILVATPLNFVGNKLWSFAPRNSGK